MAYTYRSGQRPLDGYTLKRGVGQGGFGEVYFAVSDGGKEVALKLLRSQSEVELRGVANCLNLKHPNLVHIYDLRVDSRGGNWLVMEYVLGESLANVLDRHPNGLPVHLASEWFQCLSRAVGYLHDHGVVHRDLKPANIFVENGNLKVGDYGLCKAMTGSGRQQTQTVGTVHYMAPEISTGNYTKSIDIYACGVMLHEMLTGKLPFDGETDGEILMKHLTATPTLDGVPAAFRAVVGRSLEKNPLDRYSTLAEMARAVEAAYPTQGSPVPPPLARPAAAVDALPTITATAPVIPPKAKALPVAAVFVPPPSVPPPAAAKPAPVKARVLAGAYVPLRARLDGLTAAFVKAPLVPLAGTLAWTAATQTTEWAAIGRMFLIGLAVTWGVLAATVGAGYRADDRWGRRMRQSAVGLCVGLLAFWLDGRAGPELFPDPETTAAADLFLFGNLKLPEQTGSTLVKYVLYFGGLMGACRWWRATAADRPKAMTAYPVVAVGIVGMALGFLWPWEAGAGVWVGVAPAAMAAVAVQWVSPWLPPPPPVAKKLRWQG